MPQNKKTKLLYALPAIVLSALLAVAIVYAWTEPSAAPPGNNVPAPINVGSDIQNKTGGLNIGGNVGIGTTGPGEKLDVVGATQTDYLVINPQDGINEGGELRLDGTGGYGNIQIDNYQGNARIHTLASDKQFQVLGGGAYIGGNLDVSGSVTAGNLYGASNQQIHMPGGGNTNLYINWHSGGDLYYGGGDQVTDFSVNTSGNGYFSGSLTVGGNYISGGSNDWIFHTPDDGRTTLYIAQGGGTGSWGWSAMTLTPEGNLTVGGDISANSISGGAWQNILDAIQNFDTCKDTDGGVNYAVKGTVSKGTETHTDYCYHLMYGGLNAVIGEYYCSSGACALTEQWCVNLYGHQYSCGDGRCQKTCDAAACQAGSTGCFGCWETYCSCSFGYCNCSSNYCCGGPCFIAGTKVTISSGLLKNIEEISIGEKVLGKDGNINTVLGQQSHPIRKNGRIYSINNKIEVTPDHPFLAKDGKWKVIDLAFYQSYSSDFKVEADELKIGDILMTQSGEEKVNSIELVKGKNPEDIVYDLIVDGNQTYISGGFIVHTE